MYFRKKIVEYVKTGNIDAVKAVLKNIRLENRPAFFQEKRKFQNPSNPSIKSANLLDIAILHNQLEMVKLLCKKGASIEDQHIENAANLANEEIANLLLDTKKQTNQIKFIG